MSVDFKINKNKWSNEQNPHVSIHDTDILTPQAEFVKDLVARWGMVSALDDGEDSRGRHQLKLMPPAAVVERAMEVSNLMYKAFDDNNMLIKLPSIGEMQEIADQIEDEDRSASLLRRIERREAKETETE